MIKSRDKRIRPRFAKLEQGVKEVSQSVATKKNKRGVVNDLVRSYRIYTLNLLHYAGIILYSFIMLIISA